MKTNKIVHMVAFTLVIIGGINWGLFGLFKFDLVEVLFPTSTTLSDMIYVLIGMAAVYLVVTHAKDCKICGSKK